MEGSTRLDDVAAALYRLHHALVDAECRRYEREVGPVGGRDAWIELVSADERFGWLAPLARLMAAVDAFHSDAPLEAQLALRGVSRQIQRLCGEGLATDVAFRDRFDEWRQSEAAVAIAHAALERSLESPAASDPVGTELHERHVRAMQHEHGGKKRG